MNFLSLQKILPKTPDLWDLEDTQTWLDFIGLGLYKETFSY